jgi:adenosylcobinamide-GDP ribazoletransferase
MMATIEPFQPSGEPANGLGKDVGSRTSAAQWLAASGLTLPFIMPLVWSRAGAVCLGLGASALFLLWFHRFLLRHLGGVTGDCLGFAVYLGQILMLLAATAQML